MSITTSHLESHAPKLRDPSRIPKEKKIDGNEITVCGKPMTIDTYITCNIE